MKPRIRLFCVRGLAGVTLLAGHLAGPGHPGRAEDVLPETTRSDDAVHVNRLVEQLGADGYAMREAAERELAAIGHPALPALKAAAYGSDDPEIRARAEVVIREIRLEVPKKAMAMLQGTWLRQTSESNGKAAPKDDPPSRYIFNGTSVTVQKGDAVVQQATWTIAGFSDGSMLVDYRVSAGVNQGSLVRGIFTLNNDELRWCYSFTPEDPPVKFDTRPVDKSSLVTMKRETQKDGK